MDLTGLTSNVQKRIHRFVGKNAYAFTRNELDLPPQPKSMFTTHLLSVVGGTPVFVIGSVMTASSVLEWGIPLVAASLAGVTAPFIASNKRRKEYRNAVTEELNTFLPQVVFTDMHKLTPLQVAMLEKGYRLEIPLDGGGSLGIKLGKEWYMNQSNIFGMINVQPSSNGIAEFDTLLRNLSESNPEVAKALETASKNASQSAEGKLQKPNIASFLARNLKRP